MPTPLGNLRDITLRALDVLRESALVVAEDTRVARRLLSAHGITGKALLSYREQNAAQVTPLILARAREENVALVTDAGMPGVSDPGRELLNAARDAGIGVDVLPGAVAFVGAAVLSGFSLDGLRFNGFVPRANGARRAAFGAALEGGATSAWYEAPNRIIATLDALAEVDPEVSVFVLREWTKRFEQQAAGTAAEVKAALEQPVRGEIVLVVGPRGRRDRVESAHRDLDTAIDAALDAGLPPAAAAKALARERGAPRSEIYARVSERKRMRSGKPPRER